MAKKTRKARPKAVPLRIKLLAGLLVLIVVAGIVSVRFLETTRGKLVLLDAGFTDYYNVVQEDIDGDLRAALSAFGLTRGLSERVVAENLDRRTYPVRHWEASCPGTCSSAKVGLEFTRAARKRGAVVHSSVERWQDAGASGEKVSITVGSRKYPTHRIFIHTFDQTSAPAATSPRLALVIDDFGYSNANVVEDFLALDLPLTISVLPSLSHSTYAIERGKMMDKEVILHVPMEAENEEASEGTIRTTMDDQEIRSLIGDYLARHPGVAGVNNHQGSRATQDPRVMEAILSVLKDRGLFFLDSLTSGKSIAYNTARALGVPAARNDLFLDADTEDPAVVEERLLRLLELARKRGYAVGIGHPKPWTYDVIQRNLSLLKESGVDLVFVSELME